MNKKIILQELLKILQIVGLIYFFYLLDVLIFNILIIIFGNLEWSSVLVGYKSPFIMAYFLTAPAVFFVIILVRLLYLLISHLIQNNKILSKRREKLSISLGKFKKKLYKYSLIKYSSYCLYWIIAWVFASFFLLTSVSWLLDLSRWLLFTSPFTPIEIFNFYKDFQAFVANIPTYLLQGILVSIIFFIPCVKYSL